MNTFWRHKHIHPSVYLYQNSVYETMRHWFWFWFYTHIHTHHCLVRNSHCSATETWLCHQNEAFLLELWRDWQDNCFTKQLKYQMIQWSYFGSLENMNTVLIKFWLKAYGLCKATLLYIYQNRQIIIWLYQSFIVLLKYSVSESGNYIITRIIFVSMSVLTHIW